MFFDGGELQWRQNHYFRVRRSLQQKGTRPTKQALAGLSGRENRFVLDRLHTSSRRLLEEAVAQDCSYVPVEQLTRIHKRMSNRNDRIKRQIHNWVFRELREQIEWKAAEYGIRVDPVDPAYSSGTCSKCGNQSRTNRDSAGWFACNECGCSVDGDHNAAMNIGTRLLTVPGGKRPPGVGHAHLALKSGTLNLSEDLSSAELRPEGESTDKPTTPVVG